MKLIDKIKEFLGRGDSRMKVRGEVSGLNHAEVRATNIRGEPLTWETPVSDLRISIQTLISGSPFYPGKYRIDNSHGSLHEHSEALVFPIESGLTLSGALVKLYDKYRENAKGDDQESSENNGQERENRIRIAA